MTLRNAGWKVRQVAGRRIWYKGQAGAELVARHMTEAMNLETTMRRTKTGGFMWGRDIAELLGSVAPPPPPPKVKSPGAKLRAAAKAALEDMDSATYGDETERDISLAATAKARKILKRLAAP